MVTKEVLVEQNPGGDFRWVDYDVPMQAKRRSPDELYALMSVAIEYLRTHANEHPDPKSVARHLGMSLSRFEHAFATWIGTSPKRFISYLTKERAKKLLAKESVLAATLHTGLSSPSRLHDLMVTFEAISPGELKRGDFTISYGFHPSPFGRCLLAVTARGICHLAFSSASDEDAVTELIQKWPTGTIIHSPTTTAPYATAIFHNFATPRPLHVLVKGTNFQIKVWEALLLIPSGSVESYSHIASRIGSPSAARAVGSACGKNSIGFLIPCHRVLAGDGSIGGYRWGIDRKHALLAWEQAKTTKE